jgi:hypothetical protein
VPAVRPIPAAATYSVLATRPFAAGSLLARKNLSLTPKNLKLLRYSA